MAQPGYTPIQLYHSTAAGGVPSAASLVDGELALNSADGKLYYKNPAGAVSAIGGSSTANPLKRVVVVTDSGANATVQGGDWPAQFSDLLALWSVADVEIITVAQPAGTFYRALNNTDMGGQTALATAIALAPDYVVTILGFNDAEGLDGRTLSQIEGDALSFFTQLKAALPSTPIYYGQQIAYDTTHGTIGTLTNEQVLPRLFQVPTTGADANIISQDELGAVATTANTILTTLASLQSYISTLSQIATVFPLDYYKLGRLGLLIDGLHMNAMGARLFASEVIDAFSALGIFAHMRTNSQNWQYWDLTSLWANLYSDTGTHWALTYATAPNSFAVPFYNAIWHDLYVFANTWFNQTHMGLVVQGKNVVQLSENDFILLTVRNALPQQTIWLRWWLVGSTKPALGSPGTSQLNATQKTGDYSYLVRGAEFAAPGNYNVEFVQQVGTYYDCSVRAVVAVTGVSAQPMLSGGWAAANSTSGEYLPSGTETIIPMTTITGSSSVGAITLSGGGLRVAFPGWYRVSANALIQANSGTLAVVISLNSSTNNIANMGRQYVAAASRVGFSGTALVKLAAADTVYLSALAVNGGTVVTEAGVNAWNNLFLEGPLLP